MADKQEDLHSNEHYARPRPVILKSLNRATNKLTTLDCDQAGVLTVRPIDEQVETTIASAPNAKVGTGLVGDRETHIKNGTTGALLIYDGANSATPIWALAPSETALLRTETEVAFHSVGSSIIGAVNLMTGGVVTIAGAIAGSVFMISRVVDA